METTTKNAEETKELGKKVAASLKGGETLALVGDLGSGKTTFVQGLAEGLGIKQRIISPTFIIMRNYKISQITDYRSPVTNFYHIDLYRLENKIETEIENLGLEEIWSNPENVIAIEWAEKVRDIVPKNATWIEFEYLDDDKRRIKINE